MYYSSCRKQQSELNLTTQTLQVRDHSRLSSEVLGRFFKQDKFSSFQRQLNLYGFRKITKGGESGSYQHPHFRRGERTTLLTIRRSTKASPARVVVPVSPASTDAGTPPATVPLSNSNNGNGNVSTNKSNDDTATTNSGSSNGNNKDKQMRSATPSPPPATVSRSVLPWPRPSMLRTSAGPAPAPGAVEVSPPGSGTITTGKQQKQQQKQQQWPTVGASGTDGSRGNSWASHPDPASMTAKGQIGEGVDAVAAAEKAALDHQDAEVVSLLQRMATEAQDSPARKRAALAAQQWNGRHLQDGATPSSLQQHLQQPRFQMPRLGAPGATTVGLNEAGQAQQTVSEAHLHSHVLPMLVARAVVRSSRHVYL